MLGVTLLITISMEVIDDFLPKRYQDELESVLLRHDFPWYYQPNITTGKPKVLDDQFKYSHGFTHQFYHQEHGVQSSFYCLVQTLLHFVPQPYPIKGYYRLKANMTVPVQGWNKDTVQEPHVDMPIDHLVCLYYVNDSDGDTFFFENYFEEKGEPESFKVLERVKPKKGRAVVFDGLRYHGSNCPIESQSRVIINAGMIVQ